jgi:hypothetical protein
MCNPVFIFLSQLLVALFQWLTFIFSFLQFFCNFIIASFSFLSSCFPGQMEKSCEKMVWLQAGEIAYARKNYMMKKPLSSSEQLEFLRSAAEKTRQTIESAIASMKTLPVHDTRMQEYHKSITLLADDIRFGSRGLLADRSSLSFFPGFIVGGHPLWIKSSFVGHKEGKK